MKVTVLLWSILDEMVTPVLPGIRSTGILEHLDGGKLIRQTLLILLQEIKIFQYCERREKYISERH